jgi:hypothetical protein
VPPARARSALHSTLRSRPSAAYGCVRALLCLHGVWQEVMPKLRRGHGWSQGHQRNAPYERSKGPVEEPSRPTPAVQQPTTSVRAAARLMAFAMLAWLPDYSAVLAGEAGANEELVRGGACGTPHSLALTLELFHVCMQVGRLAGEFTSGYMRRLIRSGTEAGITAAAAVTNRMRDTAGALRRARSRVYIPFSQVAKAVSFLYSNVTAVVWGVERKARRVEQGWSVEHMLPNCSRPWCGADPHQRSKCRALN